jgi:maleate cis-trans isomerase
VITNQVATVWHALQLLDCWAPLQGFGRLLLSS